MFITGFGLLMAQGAKPGQHTYKLVVDTTGVSWDSVVVTVEMADVFGHSVIGSCKVPIPSN